MTLALVAQTFSPSTHFRIFPHPFQKFRRLPWFDVVNERDEVIGRERRAAVHARGLWHRAIHVLVYNATGEVFLQKRAMRKDTAPGCWDSSCSGHVDAGEDYDAAATRELGEELGLKITQPPERLLYERARLETGWEFVWVYRLQHDGPFRLHPEEIDCGAWRTPAEVTLEIVRTPQVFAPAFKHLWPLAIWAQDSNNRG